MKEASTLAAPRYNPLRQIVKWGMTALLPKGIFVVRGPATGNQVCLTFDDGPHPEFTPRILDTLRAHGVKATFFAIGERAAQHRDIIKRIILEGHTIGSHTQNHVDMSKLAFGAARKECRESHDILAELGAKVTYFRPPWGKMSPLTLPIVAASKMAVALWSMDSMDYQQVPAPQVVERIRTLQPGPGDILLFHDDRAHTAGALEAILDYLDERGLKPVPLEKLMGRK